MSELIKLNHSDWLLGYCKDDPVRPHLALAWRTQHGREVYALQNDLGDLDAVICVAYTNEVPSNEKELEYFSQAACQDGQHGDIAVAYTVWSYARGSGREIILRTRDWIKQNTPVTRLVTLSPLTEMAERFHIKNGATLLARHSYAQNFEYEL